jgi:hypothetical protein
MKQGQHVEGEENKYKKFINGGVVESLVSQRLSPNAEIEMEISSQSSGCAAPAVRTTNPSTPEFESLLSVQKCASMMPTIFPHVDVNKSR